MPFGGRYRIIDFTLSNCVNSGIKNIGVITQYQPLVLNDHIGNGASWGLDRLDSGVTILQPYSNNEGSKWFEGTAHAIYQNIDYIDMMDPEYLLVLSGDHIYKMDYEDMLNQHKENNAALTVAVIDVPWDEASRFGIMNTDENDRITEFEEKPAEPKSNHASMGIYIFTWARLRNVLMNSFQRTSTCTTSAKTSFRFTSRAVTTFTPIIFRAIGKTLARSIPCGAQTWSSSMTKADLTFAIRTGASILKIRLRRRSSLPKKLTSKIR